MRPGGVRGGGTGVDLRVRWWPGQVKAVGLERESTWKQTPREAEGAPPPPERALL